MNNMYCPYCEHDCGNYFDDCYEANTEFEYECPKCKKNFIYTIEYYPTYSSHKVPCMNGGEHEYEKIEGCPAEYFKNKYRCKHCSKRIIKEDDAILGKVEQENKNV